MKKSHLDNLIINNPVMVQSFGLVPVLAVTKTLSEALVMSIAVIFVMLLSNIFASVFKKFIDESVEYIAVMAMIASFSSVAIIVIQRFLPEISNSMDIYLPLIVVNSLILYRVRSYSIVEKVGNASLDAFSNGAGFLIVMLSVSFVRELIGKGSLFGFTVFPSDYTIPSFSEPVFAFIIVGLYFAYSNWYVRNKKLKGAR